jgi:RNA polymerase sigma factor (sigma-70 family)
MIMEKYENLSVYLGLAKKTISKFAPQFYSGLRMELLNNDDAVSDVAHAIMQADWKWDANRKGHEGRSKSKYSYRNQCAIWAIKTYISQKYKKKNCNLSLDSVITDDEGSTFAQSLHDNSSNDPYVLVSEKEQSDNLKSIMNRLISSDLLTDKQRQQIKMYYFEDKTLLEIGNIFGVTREAIRQNIQKGLKRIRAYV